MDPLRHPDLIDLTRQLRNQWERVVDAEQAAARATWLRRRTLRDRLIDAEDRSEHTKIWCIDGRSPSGIVLSVGSDHVVLRTGEQHRFILLHQIVSATFEDAE